ncbi:hypothetical protein F2P56_013178 [Juglans regia]|uniref:non-specific serine/threonine protein kinase n=2 Tax=Juglans regia TaxID=51240 RepID=A0A2I4FG96_JUGRE|nr:LEAF RUST 10 DISEASE-RESISTANCE LOCUS RECEPTOR-LIKE PROTEIN KINASE-like 1.2 isoform X2 [Juglans regia]KAF5469080.1 hypothetical protein F2P56_013178 [Juglans regia]
MEAPAYFSTSLLSIDLLISFFIILTVLITPSYCIDDNSSFVECGRPYDCGSFRNISFPYWGGGRPDYCGHRDKGFELECFNNEYPVLQFEELKFRVLNFSQNQNSPNRMTIARMDLLDNLCPEKKLTTSLNNTLYDYTSTIQNLTLFYGCPPTFPPIPAGNIFECSPGVWNNGYGYFVDDSLAPPGNINLSEFYQSCDATMKVPIFKTTAFNLVPMGGAAPLLKKALKEGFEVEYPQLLLVACTGCEDSGGRCGSNSTSQFVCYCRDGVHFLNCGPNRNDSISVAKEKTNWGRKIGIGVGAAIGGVIITCIIFFICQKRYKKKYGLQYMPSSFQSRNISSGHPSSTTTDDPEMGSKYFGVHLFTYTELEEATNNFDSHKELGDGGFGIVYYGKLRDGRAVAVKRLYENNYKRVEQFMNEVVILTRLRHRHLVSLYGSTSRHSRELVLVYEYVPNGTVADHLHGERAKPGALPWPTRLNIAIETASALTYLHASAIIHRDVKTNNILLDDNFCVKVADFGLSRLFPTDVTHVSTAPQGTPGYVDPEYHECYQLTEKSDVFSFGVVLIELISSMPAVDITRHRHEINLSNMAVNKIQNKTLHELVDKTLGFESDSKVKRTITAVAELAFQCLQHDKESRPSMAELLEELNDIREKEYIKHKTEEVDVSADDAALLKTHSHPLSPDSALNWIASSTTSTHST